MALYDGVNVVEDYCLSFPQCTGLDEDLEDVEGPREQSAPGLHRSTRRCDLGTRLTLVHRAGAASIEQGELYMPLRESAGIAGPAPMDLEVGN